MEATKDMATDTISNPAFEAKRVDGCEELLESFRSQYTAMFWRRVKSAEKQERNAAELCKNPAEEGEHGRRGRREYK